MKLKNIIESRELLVEGKLIIYLESPMMFLVLDNFILTLNGNFKSLPIYYFN